MIVTEEEAKTKLCQETFNEQYGTRSDPDVNRSNCIGSACMAWRWYLVGHGQPIDRTLGDDNSKGYCGKAGRP